MHDKQRFEIGGTGWQFHRGEMPQGTLHGKAKNGKTVCVIRASDWDKPFWEGKNAVLMTRSGKENKWSESPPLSTKDAVKKGTQTIGNYNRDREIAAMEHQLKNDTSKAVSQKKDFGRPLKINSRKDMKEYDRRLAEAELREKLGLKSDKDKDIER